jgi:hypothetical protein
MFKKKKIDSNLSEAKSDSEAMNFMFMGLKWFLLEHTKKTVIVLLILLGSSLFIVLKYFTKSDININKSRIEHINK